MITKIVKLFQVLKDNVFKRYPVTLWAVWIASLLSAIAFDHSSEKWEWFIRIMLMVWVFAIGSLFTEEFFIHQKIKRIVGYSLSVLLAIGFIQVLYIKGDTLWGFDVEFIIEWTMRVLFCYIAWLAVGSLYHMLKCSKKPFEEYCTIAFGGVMKTTLVHGLFALGVAIIMLIMDALLFDVDDYIVQVEIVLAGWIYLPGVILAVSDVKKEIGKFYSMVIKFVLMPLTIAAFFIIYLYIFKLLITFSLPSNEVFEILAFLFVIGLPIWTMGSVFADGKIGKIATFLPYVFCPFIVLQLLCVGLRIGQYGLTDERYMGCFLIVFEILYIVIYTLFQKKFLPFVFFILAGLFSCYAIVPFINVTDMIYMTQKSTFISYLSLSETEKAEMTEQQKRRMTGAFHELKYDRKGKAFLKTLSKEDESWVEAVGETIAEKVVFDSIHLYANQRLEPVNVSGYQKLYTFDGYHNDVSNLEHFEVNLRYDEKLVVDISQFISLALDYYNSCENGECNMDAWLEMHTEIPTENGTLLVENFSISKEDENYQYINLSGYYLVK